MSFLWGDWWEFLDEETGRFYYYNESTQQSLWVKPEMPIQTPTGDATADSGEESFIEREVDVNICDTLSRFIVSSQYNQYLKENENSLKSLGL
jgi:hypothetical protein